MIGILIVTFRLNDHKYLNENWLNEHGLKKNWKNARFSVKCIALAAKMLKCSST